MRLADDFSRYSRTENDPVQILYMENNLKLYLPARRDRAKLGSSHPHLTMPIIIKLLILAFLVGWTWLGGYLVIKYGALFGPNADHRAESPGARSFGIAHIAAVWVGAFALAVWFLFL